MHEHIIVCNGEINNMKKHQIPPIPKENPRPPKAKKPKDAPDAPLPPLPELPKNIDDMKEELNQLDKEIHMLRSKLADK